MLSCNATIACQQCVAMLLLFGLISNEDMIIHLPISISKYGLSAKTANHILKSYLPTRLKKENKNPGVHL